jgi:hypothetical protein
MTAWYGYTMEAIYIALGTVLAVGVAGMLISDAAYFLQG